MLIIKLMQHSDWAWGAILIHCCGGRVLIVPAGIHLRNYQTTLLIKFLILLHNLSRLGSISIFFLNNLKLPFKFGRLHYLSKHNKTFCTLNFQEKKRT